MIRLQLADLVAGQSGNREGTKLAYYLNLFSPETYESFQHSGRDISGFRIRQQNAAERIRAGDKLLCYLTRLGRWFGILEVVSGPFVDHTPIFLPEDDPFVVRFKVRRLIVLDVEKALPIREDPVWQALSFTKGHDKGSSTWTGKIRASLTQIDDDDGRLLEELLNASTK
jgi:predicted RNA-binding protein